MAKGRDGYAGLRLSKQNEADKDRRNDLIRSDDHLLDEIDALISGLPLDRNPKAR